MEQITKFIATRTLGKAETKKFANIQDAVKWVAGRYRNYQVQEDGAVRAGKGKLLGFVQPL